MCTCINDRSVVVNNCNGIHPVKQGIRCLVASLIKLLWLQFYHTNIQMTLGLFRKHVSKSEGRSTNWYSYLECHLADILPIFGEGILIGRGRLYGTLRYMPKGIVHSYPSL